jgi:hypothetical protein
MILFAVHEPIQFIHAHLLRFDAAHFGVHQHGAFPASGFQNSQHRAPVKPCEPFNGSDADTLTEHLNDLVSLCGLNPHIAERTGRNVTESLLACPAAVTLITLEETEFERLILAAMTRHLTLSRPDSKVTVYLLDTATLGFGLWLRPGCVDALPGLCLST